MRILTLTVLFICSCSIGFSQNQTRIDILKHQLDNERQDTNRVAIMLKLYQAFSDNLKLDSAQAFAEKALDLATKIHYKKGEFEALIKLLDHHIGKGDSPKALLYGFKAIRMAEGLNDHSKKGETLFEFARIYILNLQDYQKAKIYLKQSIQEFEAIHDVKSLADIEGILSTLYRRSNQFDSMLIYQQKAYAKYESLHKLDSAENFIMFMGQNHFAMGDYPLALSLYQKALIINQKMKGHSNEVRCLKGIASVYEKMNRLDSTIYYEKKALEIATTIDYKSAVISTNKHLADLYELQNKATAYKYLKMAWDVNESLNGSQKFIALERTISEEQERQYQAEAERIASQNRIKQYLFLGGLGILLLIAFLLYSNNRQKQKANNLLHQQKQEIDFQRNKAEKALAELKSTQAQLIQSEKLASLGELTAGIAHEIQNPLNFVNNFSEVSAELVQEIKEERQKPKENQDETLVDEIFNDITQNLQKITLHGNRASSIVKGMLEHSRTSTGIKELTDINQLADEYLRLSYHGFKAKNDSFDADLKTDFDENLPKIEVIPQDMGRVLLNLINNAFWAVNEKSKKGEAGYEPKVKISTLLNANSQLLIAIKDNGLGMTEEVKAKIFQPFFTTKPTGQGTGLGLSLAYDIVTKGHGGTIDVESVEGEGTTLIVKLPIV